MPAITIITKHHLNKGLRPNKYSAHNQKRLVRLCKFICLENPRGKSTSGTHKYQ